MPDLQNLHSLHSGVLEIVSWGLPLPLFYLLERNDMVAWLDIGYTFTNGFDNTSALMPEHDWEGTFWVFA